MVTSDHLVQNTGCQGLVGAVHFHLGRGMWIGAMGERAKVTSDGWPPSNGFGFNVRVIWRRQLIYVQTFWQRKNMLFSSQGLACVSSRFFRLIRQISPCWIHFCFHIFWFLKINRVDPKKRSAMPLEIWVMAAKQEDLYSKVTPRRQRQNRPGTIKHGSALDVLLSMGFPKTRAWVLSCLFPVVLRCYYCLKSTENPAANTDIFYKPRIITSCLVLH